MTAARATRAALANAEIQEHAHLDFKAFPRPEALT